MKKGIRVCLVLDLMISGLLSILFLVLGAKLFYLFTNDESVIIAGMQVLKATAPYYMIVALYEVTGSALRGMGTVIVPMIINIAGLCVLRIACVYLVLGVVPELNTLFGIISCSVSWVFTAVATLIYYVLKSKSKLKLTDC